MKQTGPTRYPDLNRVLTELQEGLQKVLSANLTGIYLQGSFAVGGFDEHSDVDFVVAVRDELSNKQISELQILHKAIFSLPSAWAQHLEGSYFPLPLLRDYRQSGTDLWYLDNGSDSLVRSEHCNSILVRWVLREKAVVLFGPHPSELIGSIPVSALRNEMYQVMHKWGKQILSDPEKYSNRFYQGFIVLSYCRMLHDYINGFPGSKQAGAAWAKQNLDTQWRGLIERTWACRPVPEVQIHQPADPVDFSSTLEFVIYIMAASEPYRLTIVQK